MIPSTGSALVGASILHDRTGVDFNLQARLSSRPCSDQIEPMQAVPEKVQAGIS